MTPIVGGQIRVFSFKEGLLSKVAHDLQFSLGRFEVESDGQHVVARMLPSSLEVEGVMRKGQLDAHGVSDADKQEIEGNLRQKVLQTDAHPRAVFSGDAVPAPGGYRISGSLTLAGRTRDLAFEVRQEAGHWRAEIELVPSLWGIKPFKAWMGAIKLQDRVVVRIELPVVAL